MRYVPRTTSVVSRRAELIQYVLLNAGPEAQDNVLQVANSLPDD